MSPAEHNNASWAWKSDQSQVELSTFELTERYGVVVVQYSLVQAWGWAAGQVGRRQGGWRNVSACEVCSVCWSVLSSKGLEVEEEGDSRKSRVFRRLKRAGRVQGLFLVLSCSSAFSVPGSVPGAKGLSGSQHRNPYGDHSILFPAGKRALKRGRTFAYASCVECVMQI